MINPSYVLVTTALKETRALDSCNLFLGDWCLDFDEKSMYPDSVILKYHWSDFSKLESDYILIGEIYEKFLIIVGNKLNEIHGVSYSSRYWRILIGPWLGYFIQGMFDKWQNLTEAFENYKISQTIIIDFPIEEMIPNDMTSFAKLLSRNDWNHYCYNQIISHVEKKFKFEKHTINPKSVTITSLNNSKIQFYNYIIIKIKFVLNLLSRKNKVVIASSYLGFVNDLKLNFKLKQFPFFYNTLNLKKDKIDFRYRDTILLTKNDSSDFELLLANQIFKHIPTCFLEGYNNLQNRAQSNFYPSSPSIIYTANFTTYDVISMAYTASHVERGAKLIHGQHGGYGIPRFMFMEDHEIKISDFFLSWGWTKNKSNVIPLGMPIPIGKYTRNHLNEGYLLVVRGLWPKYMFRIDSGSGLNLNNTIEDCLNFVSLLRPAIVQKQLQVRLYHSDYGFDEKTRWVRKFPDISFGNSHTNIYELVKKSKLVVYTYNVSTGYLEYINANIPTILFWNMNASPVSDEAIEVFIELKNVGIYHDTFESASEHINKVWDNVDSWWNSPDVVKARYNLCHKFARIPSDVVEDVHNILRNNL